MSTVSRLLRRYCLLRSGFTRFIEVPSLSCSFGTSPAQRLMTLGSCTRNVGRNEPMLLYRNSSGGTTGHGNTGTESVTDPDNHGGSSADDSSSFKSPTVLTERIDHLHIMSITLNRPEKRNCVDTFTAHSLHEAFLDFEADDNMYCCVLRGTGGNFCAGFDLEELASLEEENLANVVAMNMMDRGPMGPTRMELSKPVIAAIEGWCVAGGMELALMADLRVMESDAKIGFLNRRFGVPLIDGGTVRLPHLIGFSRALDLILTGRIVDAEEALHIGLINRCVKPGTAYGRAMHLAKEIVAHPQECLKADRNSCYYAMFDSKSFEKSLQVESEGGLQIISKESIQGAKKFVSTRLGRHGKFNVTPVAEPQEWQKEFKEMMVELKTKQNHRPSPKESDPN